jgi:hypothetical protein
MSWHLCPKWIEARNYAPGKSYDAGDDCVAGVNVMADEDRAILSMGINRGEVDLSIRDLVDLARKLHEAGFNWLTLWRREGRRMPFGRRVRSIDGLHEYEIDLAAELAAKERAP